jgi:hypothetical protein
MKKESNDKKKEHQSKKIQKLEDEQKENDLDIEAADHYLANFEKHSKKYQSLAQGVAGEVDLDVVPAD